jgi:hypothetical protein
MTCTQQHHIRNGIIAVRRILRWVMNHTQLTATQRAYLNDAMQESARIELYACEKGTCQEKVKGMKETKMTGWKTKAGGWGAFATGLLQVSAQVVPDDSWKPWLTFASTIVGSASVGLLGVGIGHKIEKTKGE